jgi:hypothetical protein
MTNFLEGLVLRAAGIPPSAAAPRMMPVADPLEPAATLEEVIEEKPAVLPRRVDAPLPRERIVTRESASPEMPRAPERVVETRERPGPAPLVVPRELEEPPEQGTEVFREERIVETQREVVLPAPPLVTPLTSPSVTHIETPRAQPLPPIPPAHREELTPVAREQHEAERSAAPRPAPPPVVVQPLVLDRTRTIVEPVREERVVETTEREVLVTPPPPLPLPPTAVDRIREEPDEPRAELSPLPPMLPREQIRPAAVPREQLRETDEKPPMPRTVVLPPVTPNDSASPLLPAPQSAVPPVSVRIGTIEIHAAAPPPPPPSPVPAVVPPSPADVLSGFDDYARIRRYTPETW